MNWSDFLLKYADTTFGILTIFVVCSYILVHLAKLKEQRKQALDTLTLISVILKGKLGEKADLILNIWVEGLKKIQDGEFSQDDAIDQFVRYLKIIAGKNGINFSDEEIESMKTLVALTLHIFVGKKSKEIDIVVNQFTAMNSFQVMSLSK